MRVPLMTSLRLASGQPDGKGDDQEAKNGRDQQYARLDKPRGNGYFARPH